MATGADINTIEQPATGRHPSVRPAELDEIRAIRQARKPRWWRWLFRVFRPEEAVLAALLLSFVISYALVTGAPSPERLWAGFSYNFYGNGTFWMFMLWCVVGTALLLMVAALPLAGRGRARTVMHGVWAEAASPWARLKLTTLWGLGGLRAYVPFLACMGVYEMNKRLIPAIRGDTLYDQAMANFEYSVLGDLSSAMVRKFMDQQWISDLIGAVGLRQIDIHEACYISYVYAAPALALAMWFFFS
jgi:hypothetical protein